MLKKAAYAVTDLPSDHDRDFLVFEDADEFLSNRPPEPMQDVQAKVREAQEELLHLRQRQEEIERQQQQLELIRQKQERFGRGKRELTEKLSRTLSTIESELYNTQKLAEELGATHDSYNRHLDILRALQPEKWQRHQVDEELDRALAAIEEAQTDFAKSSRRLDALRPTPAVEAGVGGSFSSNAMAGHDSLVNWAKRGFAFIAVPMIAAILIGLLVAKILF